MATQLNSSSLHVKIEGKDELSPQFNALESRLIRFVGAIGAGIAAIRIGTAPIIQAAQFERELANVQKTTNFTKLEIKQLGDELLSLSTKIDVSATDLAKIAAAAGQQGLGSQGVQGVLDFTESVSRMSSVLDITAEQAATGIGKIVNIFKIPLSEIERTVSVINEVSNNSTAQGEELLDVIKRIGDATGLLDLKQATALAATGLDFGQSPEVVGTAYAKVFTSLTQKAEAFGRLLYGTTTDATKRWLADLDTDGLEAFKSVLSKIRELNVVDQQNTIVKLFGAGRIGALINKQIQDTTNSVLERNYKSAIEGNRGISALREQATVLNTLDAQAKLALNSLIKLGNDASQQLLQPLTRYASQLNAAFQNPSLKAFVSDLFGAMGDVAQVVANTISYVASLNVNWSNFIQIGKLFVALKLAEGIGSFAANALGLSKSLKSISGTAEAAAKGADAVAKSTSAAAAAQAAANSQFQGSKASQVLGYQELSAAVKRYADARIQAEQLVRQKTQREALKNQAEARVDAAQTVADRNRAQSNLAAAQVKIAEDQKTKVIADAAQAQANIQAEKQARIVQQDVAYMAQRTAIEQRYQAQAREITATGSRAGLAALKAAKEQEIATLDASNARSIRGINSYWDRRIAIEAARQAELIALQDAAIAQAVAKRDTLQGRQAGKDAGVAKATVEATAAAAAVASTDAALARANASLAANALSWNTVKLAAASAGAVIRTVGGIILGVASKLLSAFSWVTIVYSLADMFGVIDKLAPAFQRLTDKLGLTSAAKRQAVIDSKNLRDALDKERMAVEALSQKYNESREIGAAVSKDTFDALATSAGSNGSAELRKQAIEQLSSVTAGAQAKFDQEFADAQNNIDNKLEALNAKATEYQSAIARLQVAASRDAKVFPADKSADGAKLAEQYKQQIEELAGKLAAVRVQMDETRKAQGNLSAEARSAAESLKNAASATASLFTLESLQIAKDNILAIGEARQEAKRLEEAYKEAQQAINLSTSDDDRKARQKAADDALAALAAQNNVVESMVRAFREIVKQQLAIPSLSDTARKSIQDLLVFINLTYPQMKSLVDLAGQAGTAALTGKNAGVRGSTTSNGDGSFDPKTETELQKAEKARKLMRARLAREKAENEASRALQEEGNKQQLDADQRLYDQGLIAIEKYYANREKIQQDSISNEITRRREDLKAISAEKPEDPADKVRLEADRVRLEGEIAVLQKSRDGVRAENAEAVRKARQQFNDNILAEQNKLSEQGLLGKDVAERFASALDELRNQYRDTLAKMRADGETGLADSLEKSLPASAAERAIAPLKTQIDQQYTALQQFYENLNLAAQQGKLTTQEATDTYNAKISEVQGKIAEYITQQSAVLEILRNSGSAGTTAYENIRLGIEAARLALANLANEQNRVAQSINQNVTSALANSLANMKLTFSGIKDAATDFLLTVANQLKTLFAQNLAQNFMKGIGSLGNGGIGGFVSSLLGGGRSKPDGTANNPIYTKTAGGLSDIAQPEQVTSDLITGLTEKIKGVFSDLPSMFSGLFDDLQGSLGGIFDSLISSLSGLFGGGGGGGAGGFVGFITSLFMHTGGIVGTHSSARKLVSPALFANATRYHSSGIMGLKPNEVPIIAQKGEEMLTERDPRHRKNLKSSSAYSNAASNAGDLNVWIVSPDQVPSMGPNDVIATVADNIGRGGSIKQLIKTVSRGG